MFYLTIIIGNIAILILIAIFISYRIYNTLIISVANLNNLNNQLEIINCNLLIIREFLNEDRYN